MMHVQFPRRPRKTKHPVLQWEVREWLSSCGGYKISLAKLPGGLSEVYHAMAYGSRDGRGVWEKISNHRQLSAAMKACEDHAKKNSGGSA
jgi:hypothetical protein